MQLKDRIDAFASLGQKISSLSEREVEELTQTANQENKWFTPENIKFSINGILKFLDKDSLQKWVGPYEIDDVQKNVQVGIVMAGNIPMVGFHDLLSVLISGNKAAIKPSSEDTFLIKKVITWLLEVQPAFEECIFFPESLKDVDAVIATGSDNTARYFEYYFGKKPNIIRRNRTSVAILNGEESSEEMENLGQDIFTYFGLGCRNISKLYYPTGYDIRSFFPQLEKHAEIIHHHKYRNNYDYNKSILLVNKEKHFDTGFLLTKEDENLVSPISVLFTESYDSPEQLSQLIHQNKDKIQCIATSLKELGEGDLNIVPFGKTQEPELWDYADGVDTLTFLTALRT